MSAPAGTATLPNLMDVRVLLEDLLGREVEIRGGDAWAPTPADYAAVAEFVDDHLKLRAIAVLDLPLSVHLGAAIGLVPAPGAKDMVESKSPSPMVVENLYEVLNVLSATFNKAGALHLKIYKLHAPGAALPADVAGIARRLTARLDLTASVKGYGGGRLGLVLAD